MFKTKEAVLKQEKCLVLQPIAKFLQLGEILNTETLISS